jgi:hypothetical protein
MKGKAEAALDRPLAALSSGSPALAPAHEAVGDLQLLDIDLR